ncbi:MAG: 50S ribosomal protein L22 [Saprospiraceae bacterium]|nr:50S ribosomal protein L22 [Pyrinomonadaceae bacterium]
MEAIAKLRHLKGSPRKARLVIDLIRGRNVSQALSILKFTNKRAALPIAKCLSSAIANATYLAEQQNIAIDPDGLWINTCFIDMGPTKNRRRVRPAPQGRAYREQRHYCHITIHVTSEAPPVDEKAAKAAEGRAARLAAKKADGSEVKAKAPKKAAAVTSAKLEELDQPIIEQASEEIVDTATPNEVAETVEAKSEGEIADAKNATSQTPAEKNETQPADEAQQKINEDLERQ